MKAVILLISLFFPFILLSQEQKLFFLQNGDLIFQEACAGEAEDMIKEVTTSAGEYNFTHVGMVYINEKDSIYVIEATIPVVKMTPLKEYLYPESGSNCYPVSVVGRLIDEYQHLIPEAIREALKHVGKEYDYAFDLNNDKFYCSELVYKAFLQANEGVEVFPLNVMTFKSPQTGEFTEGWIKWFGDIGMPIPEGAPGINPGAMSRSGVITIYSSGYSLP